MFPEIVGFPRKSSILIGFAVINHPFWGTAIFWKHLYVHYLPHVTKVLAGPKMIPKTFSLPILWEDVFSN